MTQKNKLKPSINLHNKKVPEKENCTVKRGCLNPVLKLVLIKDIIYNVQMEHLQSLLGIVFLTNLKKD